MRILLTIFYLLFLGMSCERDYIEIEYEVKNNSNVDYVVIEQYNGGFGYNCDGGIFNRHCKIYSKTIHSLIKTIRPNYTIEKIIYNDLYSNFGIFLTRNREENAVSKRELFND